MVQAYELKHEFSHGLHTDKIRKEIADTGYEIAMYQMELAYRIDENEPFIN